MSPIRALKRWCYAVPRAGRLAISHDRHEPDKGTETIITRAMPADVVEGSRQT